MSNDNKSVQTIIDTPDYAKIEPGYTLKELLVKTDHTHIFMFSAITWNRHLIHYNQQEAICEGHKNVLVQRGLIGNYFARLMLQWIGDSSEMTALSWKMVTSAVPDDQLTCKGEVIDVQFKDGLTIISCELQIIDQDSKIISLGEATIKTAT